MARKNYSVEEVLKSLAQKILKSTPHSKSLKLKNTTPIKLAMVLGAKLIFSPDTMVGE